jgi:hypothetical protein
LLAASTAKYGIFVEFTGRPCFWVVPGELGMAFIARIPPATAFELYRDDVKLAMPVGATRLRVDTSNAMNRLAMN